jgi:hypothetical protein
MGTRWPADTTFTPHVLTVEQEACDLCQRPLHICDHRFHRIHTFEGPVELICKLARCPDPNCPAHAHTVSPLAEAQLALPWWVIDWKIFCWLGHRRFARHWSVPQLQMELRDSYHIALSDDAIARYLRRYQTMVAARHQDATVLADAYQGIESLVLTIDGLQPEKGHETLYVVRELRSKRVWFAEALLSSSTAEVQRLIAKAKQWAEQLGRPVVLWMSDKQDAFVKGVAAEFPGVPHRYCQNHFLRDVAAEVLKADSQAKVQMRRKVRGLRAIEREVLEERRAATVTPTPAVPTPAVPRLAAPPAAASVVSEPPAAASVVSEPPAAASVVSEPPAAASVVSEPPAVGSDAVTFVISEPPATKSGAATFVVSASTNVASPKQASAMVPGQEANHILSEVKSDVVLDYCAAVRGILNDDQGGPLTPPGLRMAEALSEVRASLQRNLEAKKGGALRHSCSV